MGNKQSVESALPADFPPEERLFGLRNFNSTCYFNSVIQSLYVCQEFREKCLDFYEKSVIQDEKPANDSILTCLSSLFHQISNHKNRSGVLQPRDFITKLREENELFNNPHHQDAQEFLIYLLNQISDDLKGLKSPAEKCPKSTWIQSLFEGTLSSETQCLRCENVTKRDEQFIDLSLDIEENSSVTRCLQMFSSKTILNKRDKYECSECCCKQEAHKCLRIKRLPKVLILHLKRFKYIERFQSYKKLCYRVSFPFHLKVETVEGSPDAERDYRLYAVIIHIGSGMRFGHYITMVKNHGRWFMYDDDHIQIIRESEVQRCFGSPEARDHHDGYLLFYQS
eukprot:59862_1